MESLSTLFPTDNLYKFMAISGLLILGFCTIYPNMRAAELNRRVIDLEGQAKMLKLESDIQSRKDSTIMKGLDKISLNVPESNTNEEVNTDAVSKKKIYDEEISETVQLLKDLRKKEERDYFEFRIKYDDYIMPHQKEEKELKEIFKNSQAIADSIKKKAIMIKNISEQITTENDIITQILFFSVIGAIVGICMSCFGFNRWYVLLQKPQDEIMKLQLKEYRQKFSNESNNIVAP